ncbi:hypothetical protein RHMOL_Rhmol09G0051600 [Rhododendron molle]|uniref:Uncharacterized protein n=1 Tax=Rhododendron molle TaxID=49168 RepID=A0ACC0MB24_RHOML|nr:hypothetical protein RHMOL_Rhmol09G0051600 [Rhododendron molle]
MAALQTHQNYTQFCNYCSPTPKLPCRQNPSSVPYARNSSFTEKVRVSSSRTRRGRDGLCPICCRSKTNAEAENVSLQIQEEKSETERPPFDINLAVILAGFAFEAYATPPENIGRCEVDAANCKTVFLSESFLHEIYDGQLFISLKKGLNLPAMDPWGTSDPYVVLQLDSQVVKSKVKWGTKEPTWNEDFTLNIKLPPTKNLQSIAKFGSKKPNTTSGLPFGVLIYRLLAQARVPEHRDEDIVPSLDFSSYTVSRIDTLSTAHAAKTEMRMMQNLMMRLTSLLPRRNFSMSMALLRLLLVLPRPRLLVAVVMNLWMAFKDCLIMLVLVAAWDANLVTPHKRMGNGSINLECLCDGTLHEVLVELEGMGGGGKIQLEVRYKSFDQIDEEKKWWRIPIITEFLRRNGFESALKRVVGSETVQARQFVQFAFGKVKSLNDAYFQKDSQTEVVFSDTEDQEKLSNPVIELDMPRQEEDKPECSIIEGSRDEDSIPLECNTYNGDSSQSDKQFWKNFSDLISQNVVQKLGLPLPDKLKWDGLDLLNGIGLQARRIAEAGYVESGLATSEGHDVNNDETTGTSTVSNIQSSLPDIKKVTEDLLRQTDSILGALMVVNAAVSQLNKEGLFFGKSGTKEDASTDMDSEKFESLPEGLELDERKAEEMRELFTTAESAMEAWAMLATSLGHPSFIKSEFEKICFLDNPSTDTQVAIWRDSERKRLVVAFRGTEQVRWKDLRTDLMLVPAGLNPERIGGDFRQEVQVHSGFLSAYDSVRTRILSLIKLAVAYIDDGVKPLNKWHIYVTGHSLGGALATLLALELSSSQLAKEGAVSVSMYNFGSPRVGNKKFAEVYNEKVKDSWRVVNHRDIIPTVPRLMGYCHVAQPIYLAPGDLKIAMVVGISWISSFSPSHLSYKED